MLNLITGVIEYLKRPELVIKVQEFFGIQYITKKNITKLSLSASSSSPSKLTKNNSQILNNHTTSVTSSNNCSNNQTYHQNGIKNEKIHDDTTKLTSDYIIGNKFWYYLFLFGTELGDEIFYATFIPFWFWNIDGAVGRRVIFLWSLVMYIGQSLKDIIQWPRPGPPVARLQKKWGLEYGMPSTHAMVAVSIPFSVLIFTHERYIYPIEIGIIFAILWCSVICLSRLYLGMHSVCDVVAGLLLTIFLMIFLVPLVDFLDIYILSSKLSPIFVLFISIMLIVYYPSADIWTPTRNDTAVVVSVSVGIQLGAWINYQMGDMIPTTLSPPPYPIIWPTYSMLGLLILRTVLGMCYIVAAIAIGKFLSYGFVCMILGKDKNKLRNSENHLENTNKIIVELSYKYFTYGLVGFNTQYLMPNFFKILNIGRPDFYTEI